MWDDYSFIRDGCPPRSAYGNGNPIGVIQFTPATVPNIAAIGALVGYLSVVGGTGLYAFSITNNLYFKILGNQVRVKGPLNIGSFPVTITAQSTAGKIVQSFIVTVIGALSQVLLADSLGNPLQDSEGVNILADG